MMLELVITQQGAPQVYEADIVVETDTVICAYIHLDSWHLKGLEPTDNPESNCPGLSFWAGERSIHLHKGEPVSKPTYLEFPGLRGWEVFSCLFVNSHTASVVIINESSLL